MTHSIRIHSLVPYDRGGKARWLLTELGVDFQTRWVDRAKKEHESPEFLKLNPMGRVPVAEVDGRAIFESSAICASLADLYLDRGLAPALHAPERAQYQQWMYFAASTIDAFQARIMIIEDIPPGEVRQAKEKALFEDLQDALTALDRVLSRDSFLVGNCFSTADICVGYHLYFCMLWPELNAVIQEFPTVVAYLNRLKERPAAVESQVFTFDE